MFRFVPFLIAVLVVGTTAAMAAPPSNDSFANAIALTGTAGNISVLLDDATVESGEPFTTSPAPAGPSGPTPIGRSVWYKWVAPQAGKLDLEWVWPTPLPGWWTTAFVGSSVNSLVWAPVSTWWQLTTTTNAIGYHAATEVLAGEVLYLQLGDFGPYQNLPGLSITANFGYTFTPSAPAQLVSAVLPLARSVTLGTSATVFGSAIYTGAGGAYCWVGMQNTIQADFQFRATDANHNFIAPLNVAVFSDTSKPANFVIGVTSKVPINSVDVPLVFTCEGSGAEPIISGLNTFVLSASNTPVPDLVSISATATNDGIANIAGANGSGTFVAATVNIGVAASITATVDSNGKPLPLATTLCRTDPQTGTCINPSAPATSSTFTLASNEIATFTVFITGSANVPFDPANNRLFLRFKTTDGVTRGATSVAVRTQ